MLLIASCDFISNAFEYRKRTEEFTAALLQEDYDRCVSMFAMDHELAQNIHADSLKAGLPALRIMLLENFGKELEYTLISSGKSFSTKEGESTPPNTTEVFVQINNQEEFGILELLYDDTSKKLLNFRVQNVREKIPNMLPFWLFGLLALCIPIFNVYVIYLLKKSDIKRKWPKYLAVLLLNVPTITYSAVNGLIIKPLSFQFLFGISFSYMGYINAMWAFGIPLGGIYWFLKLKKKDQDL